jgi:hypothetical protein
MAYHKDDIYTQTSDKYQRRVLKLDNDTLIEIVEDGVIDFAEIERLFHLLDMPHDLRTERTASFIENVIWEKMRDQGYEPSGKLCEFRLEMRDIAMHLEGLGISTPVTIELTSGQSVSPTKGIPNLIEEPEISLPEEDDKKKKRKSTKKR